MHLAVDPSGDLAVGYLCVASVGVLTAIVVAFNWNAFDLTRFQAPGVFVVSFFGLVLLGAPTVFAAESADPGASRFLAYSSIGFIATVVGAALAGRNAPRSTGNVRARTPWLAPGLAGLAAFAAALLGVYLVTTPRIPVIDALRGARQSDLREGRQESLSLLGNEQVAYLFTFVRGLLLPFLMATILVWWIRSKRHVLLIPLAVIGGLTLFASVATLEKSPVVRLLLILVVAAAVELRSRPRTWQVIGVVLIGTAFPFVVTTLNTSSETSSVDVVQALSRRAVIVPSEVSELYFEWAPEESDGYLLGRTIPHLSKVLDGGPFNAPRAIYSDTYGTAGLSGGSANASVYSFLWIDFSLIGIIVGGALVGALLAWLQRAVNLTRPTVFGPPLQAVLVSQTIFLSMTSVFAVILQLPYGLPLLVVLAVVIWNLGNRPNARELVRANAQPAKVEIVSVNREDSAVQFNS